MQTLTAVAESMAKLQLSSEVCVEDALLSCYIFEENISALSGYSFLNIQPSLDASSLEQILGKSHDKTMQMFHQDLDQFFRSYLTGFPEE